MALLIANSSLNALEASASLERTPAHVITAAAQLPSLMSRGDVRLPKRPSAFALVHSPLRFDAHAHFARGPDGSLVATAAHGLVFINTRDPARPALIGTVTAPAPRGLSSTPDRLFVLLAAVSAARPQARLISAPNTSLAAIAAAVAARSPAVTYSDASQAPLALWGPDSSYAAGADFIVVLQPSGLELRSADAALDLLATQLLPTAVPAVVEVVARPDLELSAPLLAAHRVWDLIIISERGGEAALVRYDRIEETSGDVRHKLAVVRPFALAHAEGPISLSQAYSHAPPDRSCGAHAPVFALALHQRDRLQTFARALDGTLVLDSESFFGDLHGVDALSGSRLVPAIDDATAVSGIERPVARTIGTARGELRLHSGLGSLDRRFGGPSICAQGALSPLTVSGDGLGVIIPVPAAEHDWSDVTIAGDQLIDHGTVGGADATLGAAGEHNLKRSVDGPGSLPFLDNVTDPESTEGTLWTGYLPVASVNAILPTTPAGLTYATWFRTEDPAGVGASFFNFDVNFEDPGGFRMRFRLSDAPAQLLADISWDNVEAPFDYEELYLDSVITLTSAWHHIMLRWDRSTLNLRVYLDGAIVASGNVTRDLEMREAGDAVVTSDFINGEAQFYAGTRIYRHAVSDAEIKALLWEGGVSI